MSLLLEWVIVAVRPAKHGNRLGQHFRVLPLAARFFHLTLDTNAAAGREVFDFRFVVFEIAISNDLNIAETASVVDFNEAEPTLGITPRADPATRGDLLADRIGMTRLFDRNNIHVVVLWITAVFIHCSDTNQEETQKREGR